MDNSKLIAKIQDVKNIQCSDGNWNYDPYMHGMANGIICALAILEDVEPVYLDAPKIWLADIETPSKPTVAPLNNP